MSEAVSGRSAVNSRVFAEQFLEYPDLFPGRLAGEHCGLSSVTIEFVGGPYRFVGLSDAQATSVRQRFGPLCLNTTGDDGAAVEAEVYRAAVTDFREFDPIGWETWIDLDYTNNAVRLAGRQFMGRLEWGPELRAASWTSTRAGDDFLGCFENFFRVVVAYRLLECGGVLLHSAGVVDDGRVCLFLGRSGAGKSTISRLSLEGGRAVLSDDLNALVPSPEGARVEKLPFAGDCGPTASAGRYPLRGLYRLEKGSRHSVRAISPGQAMALLVACAPFVNGDPCRLEVLTANIEALIASAETGALTFAMDDGFWLALRQPRGVVE